jgi:phosphoesterase RecJ-like protein
MTNGRWKQVKQAAAEIRRASKILLACHVRPDADALGSLLGLMLGLEALGKEVHAVSQDGVPPVYRFLPHWERVRATAEGRWDLGIGLDADGSDRLGSAEAAILAQPVVIDLDHHSGPDQYGQVRVVDPTAAATGELVYHLLAELGVAVTEEIAVCLLAAILTDTGSFRYGNVTSETFQIASALAAAGAHPAPIFDAIYGSRSFVGARLLGRLLDGIERSPDGRVVWAALSQQDFRELQATPDDAEGFVDQIRMVSGSDAALFFREEPDGEVRVSLRSRGAVNVARVAEEFGGGGHAPAAGCSLLLPLPEAVRRVVEAVTRHLP